MIYTDKKTEKTRKLNALLAVCTYAGSVCNIEIFSGKTSKKKVSSNEHTEWNTHECLLVICNIMTNSLIPAKFKCNSGESRVDSVHSRKKKFSKENNLRGNCSASFVGNTFYCRCTPLLILSCTFLPEFNLTRRQVITCRTSATNVLISSGI